jgi:hypothetical protein
MLTANEQSAAHALRIPVQLDPVQHFNGCERTCRSNQSFNNIAACHTAYPE